MTHKALLSLAAVLLAQQSIAQTSVEDRLSACADVADDAARLKCYDEASRPPAPPAPPVVEAAPAPAVEPEPAPAPAPAPAVAAEPEAAPDPIDDFGMTAEIAAKRGKSDADSELKEIQAQVVEVSKRTRGQYVVTLDNGQVWTEKNAEPYLRIKVGDTITIKRGRLGAYRLVGRGNRATNVVRVE